MSRAYRISVKEGLRRVVKGSDHVSTKLELLELLPREQMAEILTAELLDRGFQQQGEVLVRQQDGVTISIDPQTGDVKASTEVSEQLDLQKTGSGYADADKGLKGRRQAENKLRKATKQELENTANEKTAALNTQATEQLEQSLLNLQCELDEVVNRVTANALKQKAAQIGEIKSLTEDTGNGSMTIVVEV